jgi:hypothetical protein
MEGRRLTVDGMTNCDAHVAQLVEHVLGKDEVTRSIRVVGSTQSVLNPKRTRVEAHTSARDGRIPSGS